MARPAAKIELSESDRGTLEQWVRSPATQQGKARRARIVLLSAEGLSVMEVMTALGTSKPAVTRWRKRFRESGIAGLQDQPRSGRPTTLKPEKAQEILRLTVERIPHEATHWSERLMAKYAGVSTLQVRKVWVAADLRPHRIKNFKISRDPQFAEKVVDVVGLYMNPPTNAVVLSVDEKTQIQALDRTQPMLPLKPGKVATRTHDYARHGTASLYAAFDIATGQVIGRVTNRHRAREFLDFLRQIDAHVEPALDLHLILDNSSTHKTAEVARWLERHSRFKLHFTPTSASWLNAVEGWFGQLERRSVRRNAFASLQELRDELRRFIAAHNKHSAKPFRWTKPAATILKAVDEARATLRRLGHETSKAGH